MSRLNVITVLCVILINTLECKCSSSSFEERTVPLVEGLSPKGLRVSIPDEKGIQLFAFHGKVNSRIRKLETGTMSKDIMQPTNGRWVYENFDIQLRIGDIVHYWIFVQINGFGHRIENLSTIITELIPDNTNKISHHTSQHHEHHQNYLLCTTCNNQQERAHVTTQRTIEPSQWYRPTATTQRTHTTTIPTNSHCDCSRDQLNHISNQLNVTLMQLNSLHAKMDPLTNEVESLKEVVMELTKNKNIGTQLLLTGQQPPEGNPLEAIRSLITDKLDLYDLENKILHAQRTSSGLLFEMSSEIDKKRILLRAEKRLTNSPYQIIDPQDSAYIKGGAYQLDDRAKFK